MLVDEEGVFLSQRELPKMATIKTKIKGDNLIVASQDASSLSISLKGDISEELEVRVWGDKLRANHLKTEYDNWFSRILGRNMKLVRLKESSRPADPSYSQYSEFVSFADGYPYLLTNEKSLQELNAKLETPVPMNRFRPNMVLEGGLPFVEDNLAKFSIGTAKFYFAKRCARCSMITIDQETAKSAKEPLTVLSSFKKENGKVYFGGNLHCLRPGIVNVGDKIITD